LIAFLAFVVQKLWSKNNKIYDQTPDDFTNFLFIYFVIFRS